MAQPGKCTECGATRFSKAVGLCGLCELRRRSEIRSRRLSSPPTTKAPQRNVIEPEEEEEVAPAPQRPYVHTPMLFPDASWPPDPGALVTIGARGWFITLKVDTVEWLGEEISEPMKPMPSRPPLDDIPTVTLQEAADFLHVSRSSLYQRIKRDASKFGAVKPLKSGRWQVRVDVLKQLMEARSKAVSPSPSSVSKCSH